MTKESTTENLDKEIAAQSCEVKAVWRQYFELCKPKVIALIVFTAVVGMFMAVPKPNLPPMDLVFFACLGIYLAAGSAAAINHIVDRYVDSQMARTKSRPVATGQISSKNALIFALSLGAISMFILVKFVNSFTALLTFISLIGYAVVYTMYLKRATPQNIVIGGAAGAAPPVLGWAAMTGGLDPHFSDSFWLFLIIFIWTPPHFWALAIYRRHDYSKAKIPMLPVTHGVQYTRLHILLYTILLLVISVMPYYTGMSGQFYYYSALVLGLIFLAYAIALFFSDDEKLPLRTFVYSIYYLMAMFAVLLIDHYIHTDVRVKYLF